MIRVGEHRSVSQEGVKCTIRMLYSSRACGEGGQRATRMHIYKRAISKGFVGNKAGDMYKQPVNASPVVARGPALRGAP